MSNEQDIPYGYCHCGCGTKTVVSPHTDRWHGWTRGVPRRFVNGHGVYHHIPLKDRFWDKVDRRGPEECWEWLSSTRKGYGQIAGEYGKRQPLPAHRVSYELEYGEIPDGFQIHHECHNRSCVNPAHLRALSPSDHSKLHGGGSACAANAAKTHCIHGHEFTPENTYVNPSSGSRQCRECRRRVGRESARRRRERDSARG